MILRRRVRSYVHGSHVAKNGFTRRAAGGGPVPVVWTAIVNCTADGNTLTKTSGSTGYNAGAVSQQSFAGDGYVEWVNTAPGAAFPYCGLSVGDTDQTQTDVDFAAGIFDVATPTFYAIENGVIVHGPITASVGISDVVRIEREGTTIRYYMAGTLMHTSAKTSTGTLLVDSALATVGNEIGNAIISDGLI